MMKQPLNRLLNRKLMHILWGMQKLLERRCPFSIFLHPTLVATLTIMSILSFQLNAASLPQVSSVTVKTRAPQNELVTVWYRIPKNYHPRQKQMSRVLVLFGGRNSSGKDMASGGLEWGKWADENNAFLVSPGFKDDKYWEPEKWSGKALLNALEQIRKRYNICTDKLLFYGYSAGSQCSNLFPAWRPQLTRAWVSHACGVFHEPTTRMRFVAGLVTCGDADHARYVISRNFVENCRKKGINIIWRSFPNHPHDVPPDSLRLAREFLTYYHKACSADLTGRNSRRNDIPVYPYIGDDQEGVFYRVDSPKAKNILLEDRVLLPALSIALAWGEAE